MVTAALPFVPARTARLTRAARGLSSGAAAALSILGCAGAFVIAAFGLLVVPLAAVVAFGPALLAAI